MAPSPSPVTKTLTTVTETEELITPSSKNVSKIPFSKGQTLNGKVDEDKLLTSNAPLQLVWRNVILFIYLHLAAITGGYLLFTGHMMWQTIIWGVFTYIISGLGITAGAHRLWSHKSYKATFSLRVLLTMFQTMAFQNHVYEWCRDHRVHHKFSETHADPHNAKRGFFFAHMGWLLCRKHEAVKVKGKGIDMSDLEADEVLMFQKKHYISLVLLICFILPTLIPWFFWGEKFSIAWFLVQFRFCSVLHATWLVNSAAHLWGTKPYDKSINPSQNKFVAIFAMGEGWHNYHHVFPWDYKTAEVGVYRFNLTALFIDTCARLGLAYDLKTVPEKIVKQRVYRTGDGSTDCTTTHHEHIEGGPWGWGDKDIPQENIELTTTFCFDDSDYQNANKAKNE